MKKAKRILLLAILCFMAMPTARVDAASAKTKAIKEYVRLLAKEYVVQQRYPGSSLMRVSLTGPDCRFALIYLNNDSIPELFITDPISHADGYGSLYTYYKGKARFVAPFGTFEAYYFKKKGIIKDNYSNQGTIQDTYYRFDGKKLKKVATQGGRLDNNDRIIWKYYDMNDREVTKKNFNRLLKKYVGKAKLHTQKAYVNTAANRKKHLK